MHKSLAFFMMVVAIIDRGRSERLEKMLSDERLAFNAVLPGCGTAKMKWLSLLGLDKAEKDVFVMGVSADKANEIMQRITKELHLEQPGKGIVFSVPIHSFINILKQRSFHETLHEQGGVQMDGCAYTLIISIVNHGYVDDVMDTARDAGAQGGTIIRAHGTEPEQAQKFFGVTIQSDKDMLLIIASKESCCSIISAIVDNHGTGHEAHAIAFSVPINNIEGLTVLE